MKNYIDNRKALLDEVKALIEEGKIEDSNAKMKEVEDLDAKFEEYKIANANLEALKDNDKVVNLETKTKEIEGGKELENIIKDKPVDKEALYTRAWANHLLGNKKTKEETEVFNEFNGINNAFTHTTLTAPTLIPETVVQGIEAILAEEYPLLADVRKFNVNGNFALNYHASVDSGDAAWYALEATTTADEKNTFAQFTLGGHELAKAVTVSWKLKAMAVEEFIPFIIKELADRMGITKATAVFSGAGTTEPEGIDTALTAELNTPQIQPYAVADGIAYSDITAAMGLVHSSLIKGAKFYANNKTIWGQLAAIVGPTGQPIFIADATSGGVGRIFGITVETDGSIADGSVLLGNANKGYYMNTNEPMKIVVQDQAKKRETDYVSYEVVDGKVYETKAFALIKKSS